MEETTIGISQKGRLIQCPALVIDGRTICCHGKWLKTALIHDELWHEHNVIENPGPIVAELKKWRRKPDVFTFAQVCYDTRPKFPYPFEWDSNAVIPISRFDFWWERRVSRKLRQDVTRAKRLGLRVEEAQFDDAFIRGIVEVYNESPVRQGKRFWHYGKEFEAVKRENSDFMDRSFFLSCHLGDEFVGLMKIVMVGHVAHMLQILAKQKHIDKRPLNAMIAKAVEISEKKGAWYLTYGKYAYDGKRNTSLLDFKRRNGFEEMLFPRYHVPLTAKGRAAVKLGVHQGWRRIVPVKIQEILVKTRARFMEKPVEQEAPESKASDAAMDGVTADERS